MISATDALQIGTPGVVVTDSVLRFVDVSRRAAGINRSVCDVIQCHKDDTLASALELMLTNAVHHVYLVNDEERPEGVVSFVDILNECART